MALGVVLSDFNESAWVKSSNNFPYPKLTVEILNPRGSEKAKFHLKSTYFPLISEKYTLDSGTYQYLIKHVNYSWLSCF